MTTRLFVSLVEALLVVEVVERNIADCMVVVRSGFQWSNPDEPFRC